MNPRRIYGVFLRQVYLFTSSPARIFQIFVWVAIDTVVWGFTTKYLNDIGSAKADFTALFLGAIVLWGFLSRVQQQVMMAFLEDIYARNFLNLFASPLRISEYLTGLILTGTITSIFVFVSMLALAALAFGLALWKLGLALWLFLSILYLFGIALGIVASTFVLRFGPSAEWFVWAAAALLNPFVGVFYPVSVLPHWMQLISALLPPTYVFEGMRAVLLGNTFSSAAFGAGLGLALISLVLAYAGFAATHRYVVKQGLITRFTAESI